MIGAAVVGGSGGIARSRGLAGTVSSPLQRPCNGLLSRGALVLTITANGGDMSGMNEFEAEKKDSHKPNEGLHGVVEDEKNGKEKGRGGK